MSHPEHLSGRLPRPIKPTHRELYEGLLQLLCNVSRAADGTFVLSASAEWTAPNLIPRLETLASRPEQSISDDPEPDLSHLDVSGLRPTCVEMHRCLKKIVNSGRLAPDGSWSTPQDAVTEGEALVDRFSRAQAYLDLKLSQQPFARPDVAHTADVWRVQPHLADHGQSLAIVAGPDADIVAIIPVDDSGARLPKDDANAERLVACVNALRGIPTAELTRHYLLSNEAATADPDELFWDDAGKAWGPLDRATHYSYVQKLQGAAAVLTGTHYDDDEAVWTSYEDAVKLSSDLCNTAHMQPLTP